MGSPSWFATNAPKAGGWFDKNQPATASTQPQQQPTQQQQAPEPITANPRGEGLYRMAHPQTGQETPIPYSKVPVAKQQGYQFAGNARFNPWSLLPGSQLGQNGRQTDEEARYNKDSLDAQSKKIASEILSTPGGREMVEGDGLDIVLGGVKEAARTALGVKDLAVKAKNKITGQQPAETNEPKSAIRQFTEEPNQGFGENMGAGLETTAEFMSSEALLGKVAKLIGFAPKLADAAKIEQEIQKGTPLGKLALQALKTGGKEGVKNAALAGAQTFVKTGGDTDEALGEGTLSGGFGFGGGVVGELGSAIGSGASRAARGAGTPTAEQTALQDAYAQTAQGAVKPHLEAINEARGAEDAMIPERTVQHDTGLVDAQGKPLMRNETIPARTVEAAPKINVDETLGRVRTLSDASEELQAAADPVYQRIDDLTGGEFRKTKALMARSENPTVRAGYQKKIEGMLNDLSASGQMSAEEYKAAKGAFHQMFVLDDISKSFDRSWMGNPGATKIGNAYNGINGKQLLGAIRNARIKYGDIGLTEVFGSDRLTNLEEQAALNVTQSQRRFYGEAINNVLDYIQQKDPHLLYHFGAAGIGGAIGHATGVGFYGGAAAGVGIELGAKKLAEMMVADPKIGQNFAFAIRAGARPENYVPMIVSMIRTASENSAQQSRESAAQNQQKQEGGNEQQ